MCRTRDLLLALLIATLACAGPAQRRPASYSGIERVGVAGSAVKYDARITGSVGQDPVTLVITGTALRRKLFLNIYAIASYVKEGVQIRNAEHLAKADVPKQLYLVMERDVSARDMASAIKASITANHAESEFPDDLKRLFDFIAAGDVARGDCVCITHLPAVGFKAEIVGKRSIVIENLTLAQAVWEVYLGERNIGLTVKRGLTSRL